MASPWRLLALERGPRNVSPLRNDIQRKGSCDENKKPLDEIQRHETLLGRGERALRRRVRCVRRAHGVGQVLVASLASGQGVHETEEVSLPLLVHDARNAMPGGRRVRRDLGERRGGKRMLRIPRITEEAVGEIVFQKILRRDLEDPVLPALDHHPTTTLLRAVLGSDEHENAVLRHVGDHPAVIERDHVGLEHPLEREVLGGRALRSFGQLERLDFVRRRGRETVRLAHEARTDAARETGHHDDQKTNPLHVPSPSWKPCCPRSHMLARFLLL